jgi:hypothetical protein
MKTMPLASMLLLAALAAAPAHAGGINLSWSDCGNAGAFDETFACNTNQGSHTLVVSFEPDAPMPDMNGVIAWLDFQNVMPIPPWWQLVNVGSCRQTALTMNANFTTNTACVDFWQNQYAGGLGSYQIGVSAPNRARLGVIVATQFPGPVAPGTEYYAMKVMISNAKTVGTPSCSGCEAKGCVVLASVELQPGSPGPNQIITVPRDRNAITWQGSTGYGCIAVPTLNRTWGAIKSLYR